MRRRPRKQRTCLRAVEAPHGDGERQPSHRAEPREHQRTARQPRPLRTEHVAGELVPAAGEGREEAPVGARVARPERGGGLADGRREHRGAAVGKGMGHRQLGVDPLQSVPAQRQRVERGRAHAERVSRRAGVMPEPRQRQLLGAGAPADALPRLVHLHGQTGASQFHRRRQPIGTCTDHHRVNRHLPTVPRIMAAAPGRREREGGALWARMTSETGQPFYGLLHPTRQRTCMESLLCQVCAKPADRTRRGVLFLTPPDPAEHCRTRRVRRRSRPDPGGVMNNS
jgi:hypothetical protein